MLEQYQVDFNVRSFHVGESTEQPSIIELHLRTNDVETMRTVMEEFQHYGAKFDVEPAILDAADMDGVLPEGFYSTTNFTTQVMVEGTLVEVEYLEMDCAVRVWREGDKWCAATCPMHRAKAGDLFVIGFTGVHVAPSQEETQDLSEFRFMSNEISSERPKTRMIAHAASAMRQAREAGKKNLVVGGPAIIHSGSAYLLENLVNEGWVDVLFAGNALAAHDIEAAMMGTSLGVNLETGSGTPHGHSHHLRCINRIRRAGSIRAAVEQGLIASGVMHACIKKNVPFVLCGSIRDDGPLPDVITDVVNGQDAMRKHIPGVGVALMIATTLHSVATGNILPASVKTYCVDSDADTVIKLTDRGTHQAIGLVTDCEFFLKELCAQLGVPTT